MIYNKIIILITSIIFGSSVQLIAQDNHYWTQQYGARAALLGGNVVGSPDDNSSIYYNPGFLGVIDSSTLNLNANIYSYDRLSIKNGAGSNIDILSRQPNIYPQFLSGTLKMDKESPITWSYALFTRNHSNYYMRTRHAAQYNVIESHPGLESYIGSFEYSNQLDEQWGGLGFGYKISEKLAIGLSTFIGYRFQNYQFSFFTRLLSEKTDGTPYFASTNWYEDIYLQEFYILWKAGFSLDLGKFKAGLSISTPNLSLYGWTNVQRENSQYNLRESINEDAYSDILLIDRQESLPTHVKFPWSFALGFSYQLNPKIQLLSTCEYFTKIDLYTMVEAEKQNFIYPEDSPYAPFLKDIDFLSVSSVANAVFNFGLGMEYSFNEKYTLLGGFRTDYSHFKASEREDFDQPGILFISSFDMDLYHLSGGLTINKNNSRFTIGVNYCFGREYGLDQMVNFTEPTDYNYLVGNNQPIADVLINSYSLIIGYLHYF